MVLGLVLFFEGAVVIISHYFVEECLEFALNLIESVRVEAELVDLLEFFSFVGDGANVQLDIIFV